MQHAIRAMNKNGLPYHNVQHVNKMLAHLYDFAARGNNAFSAAMRNSYDVGVILNAIYWHDTVYDLRARPRENEINSANLFWKHGIGGMVSEDIQLVKGAILATAEHFNPDFCPVNNTEAIVMDLDVITFSYKWDDFCKINELLDLEYLLEFSEKEVLQGRLNFLEDQDCNLRYWVLPNKDARLKKAKENIEKYKIILKDRLQSI